MTTKSGKSVYLQAVTMIDPATGWIEIHTVPSARADLVANQVELGWLTHYPLPNKVIADRGNEFLAVFREMIINDCGLTVKPISSRKPQANAILERVHQTIGNILCTFKVLNMVLDDENLWEPQYVRPKSYGTHYYSIYSCPTNIWTRLNNKSTSRNRLGSNQDTQTKPYQ